jgi:hypothetical protein
MTPKDRRAFAEAMGVLAEVFNEPVSDTRLKAYFVALEDLDTALVLAAMRGTMRDAKFFPRPGEIRERVMGGSAGDHAELAWSDLLRGVARFGYIHPPSFDDPLMMPTITAVWGSWGALCNTLPSEGPELVGWMKQFKAAYATVSTRAVQGDVHRLPPGIRAALQGLATQKALR